MTIPVFQPCITHSDIHVTYTSKILLKHPFPTSYDTPKHPSIWNGSENVDDIAFLEKMTCTELSDGKCILNISCQGARNEEELVRERHQSTVTGFLYNFIGSSLLSED